MHVRSILWLLILVGFCGSARAQPCPRLQVRNPDGNYVIPGSLGDIPYSGNLALDAYVQRGNRGAPAVIVIHGGRWASGSRVAHVGQILELVTRAGYHWFSLDYRAGGPAKYEDSLSDIRSALAFIRCRSQDFGIDASRLVLLGEDSGAHLAAVLASEKLPGVIGVALMGGLYPSTPVVSSMPPMLVIHGGADTEAPVDEARQYCSKLVNAGNHCQFLEEKGASHRVENWWPSQWTYKGSLVRWLNALSPGSARPTEFRTGAVQKDIVYDTASQLALDAFLPRATAPVPAVIIVHGGGWEAGDKVTYVTPLFEPLAQARLAWFSIDYRLTPAFRNEDQIDDVRKAVRFVRSQQARFNIDPKRLVLVGESASGQIVLQVAAEDPDLAGVVSFYGVYDFNAMVNDASPRSLLVRLFHRHVLDDEARALLRRYSPLYTARREMPPVLLVNGTGERLWEQARAFGRRLSEIGARHQIVALENAPHGLENWEGHPEWMFYKTRVIEWIRNLVR
ncbi:MAG: alpha/beta hydrolase [Vicinamibacterales bacterium]